MTDGLVAKIFQFEKSILISEIIFLRAHPFVICCKAEPGLQSAPPPHSSSSGKQRSVESTDGKYGSYSLDKEEKVIDFVSR